MRWFRLYAEVRNDAKLRALTPAQRWVWLSLLCYASEQPTRGTIADVDRDLLALECADGDTDLLDTTLARLVKMRMLAQDATGLVFIHWTDRQYDKPSDAPGAVRQRVAAHRARRRAEDTPPDTEDRVTGDDGNADVTPGNAVQRIYTEQRVHRTESEDAPARADEDDWTAVGYAARHPLAGGDDPAVATGERGTRQPRGAPLPADWSLTPERAVWAAEHCPHVVAPGVATAKFMAHHRARAERHSAPEWQAEWEKWMLGDEARALQDAAARGVKAPLAIQSAGAENPHTREYLQMIEARNAARDVKIAARRAAQGVA
jgi:hypothetical protein